MEVLESMLIDDWIELIRIRNGLYDFTEYELCELRKFILGLDNNKLLNFSYRYEQLNTSYKTFLIFLGVLFTGDEQGLFKLNARLDGIFQKQMVFLDTAERVRGQLQKTS